MWETNITQQGLETLKRLLRATARKNTAVACHLFHGHLQSEMLWIVGNYRKFNHLGLVPTNITTKDILKAGDENNWSTGEGIGLLASLAGLFHDFGKSNDLFQKKLSRKKEQEPFRHEWVSILLFKQFVGNLSDIEWLKKLSQISIEAASEANDLPHELVNLKANPLANLPPIAKFIGWLILSHHRLPLRPDGEGPVPLDKIDEWKEGNAFSSSWNSTQSNNELQNQKLEFAQGTPFKSSLWCARAAKMAARALNNFTLLNRDWFQDRFSMHLSRAVLMLSDHVYSSKDPNTLNQDPTYKAYANTDRKTKKLKQKLDEHNIGVCLLASQVSKCLPKFHETLPVINKTKGKEFKKRTNNKKFTWQDSAYDLAYSLKAESYDRGFFGVNLASTGCGKTFANARIMYGLCNEEKGCRFSVALGLRVLTLQTGDALRERLHLGRDELAVMIGSGAVQDLYDETSGSESLESLIDSHLDLYEGSLDEGYLSHCFKTSPKLHKMISAPILVSTIDQLILATESQRGGKQIAPLLRLLTSDLVLDEPDDFDLSDLPALCRLVNFAGVMGSRVLLSSATLPPAIVKALFEAYVNGRKSFNKACRSSNNDQRVCCAWFDEFAVASGDFESSEDYMGVHSDFINERVLSLDKLKPLRRGSIAPLNFKTNEPTTEIAEAIRNSLYQLHDSHHQTCAESGKRISVGLVRMANIDSMVEVAKEFLSKASKENYHIHFCIYHAKFPLIIRSKIEENLDRVLARHNENKIWDEVAPHLKEEAVNHVFVVFATSVAEVGRDHDYDWSVVEPSSMRSIIQVAGRVQRHRQNPPSVPNLHILQTNVKGLKKEKIAFQMPGFESAKCLLDSKDLKIILSSDQYEIISAKQRLMTSGSMNDKLNLVDLEHISLQKRLSKTGSDSLYAALWWEYNPDWCFEMQRLTPFRKVSRDDIEYFAYLEEENGKPEMSVVEESGNRSCREKADFKKDDFKAAKGNQPWFELDLVKELKTISEKFDIPLSEASKKYATVTLKKLDDFHKWVKNPLFGFYSSE